MSQDAKKLVLDPMEALLKELNLSHEESDQDQLLSDVSESEGYIEKSSDFGLLDLNFGEPVPSAAEISSLPEEPLGMGDKTQISEDLSLLDLNSLSKGNVGFDPEVTVIGGDVDLNSDFKINMGSFNESVSKNESTSHISLDISSDKSADLSNFSVSAPIESEDEQVEKTVALKFGNAVLNELTNNSVGDKTVAVSGYSNRSRNENENNNLVKVAVGQFNNSNSGYSNYSMRGSTDAQLIQAENLKIAQTKILELEKENEKLRSQNQELISASEIIKERSDLLNSQVYEYKNDREALESSFKNELGLTKNQLNRKDAELQKAQMKIDDLDSRLKFDMKKIRIRERELENRLELLRAEKNALVRNKDEQILDSRRKIDQLQLEVDSFRQKCVELNRVLETNQDSFKRTTRALRLAMANLELQEENKVPFKKVD